MNHPSVLFCEAGILRERAKLAVDADGYPGTSCITGVARPILGYCQPHLLPSTFGCDSARAPPGQWQTRAASPLRLGQPRPRFSRPLPRSACTCRSFLPQEKSHRDAKVFPGCRCSRAPSEPSTRLNLLLRQLLSNRDFPNACCRKKTYENVRRKRQAFLLEEGC